MTCLGVFFFTHGQNFQKGISLRVFGVERTSAPQLRCIFFMGNPFPSDLQMCGHSIHRLEAMKAINTVLYNGKFPEISLICIDFHWISLISIDFH